jgi:trk system potassium uptake protein TrkH
MNRPVIRYILGCVLKIEALLMVLPCIVALIYQERSGFSFLITLVVCGLLGILMTMKKPVNFVFYLKEGCIATTLSWIFLSLFGCLPFFISREIPSFTDALFETISGFTTTGASILNDIEALSHCMLFWRSFTHWIGGMGVLVFLLAIIPLSGGSHINLMRAESPGPSVGKLVPKVRYTARILYKLYIALTLIELVLLLLGKMPVFDSICTTFGTAGTGGFGIKNDSFMSYSPYLQWVVTIFMILFGINFNAYYLILLGSIKDALKMEEIRYYLLIIFSAILIIFFNIYDGSMGIFETLRHVSFQVASIISSTGFASVDFDLWPDTSRILLVILMFIGACAGSTGGGIKVSRFVIAVKTIFREISSYIHPKSIKRIKMDDKPIEPEIIHSVSVYFLTFGILFILSLFAVSFEGKGLVTSFTAVATTINNIGPGLDLVGPTRNFYFLSGFSKYVLMFDMLAGRLELFPLLILFHPAVIRDFVSPKRKKR